MSDSSQAAQPGKASSSRPTSRPTSYAKEAAAARRFDFLVLGSGLAGLHYALRVADAGDVAIITKRRATDSATDWAQGGIAAVMDPSDSFDAHVRDTLNAGAGLCHEDTVRFVVERGPAAIHALRKSGVEFDPARQPDGPVAYDLTREGGHTRRRILHRRDATGREIERSLTTT